MTQPQGIKYCVLTFTAWWLMSQFHSILHVRDLDGTEIWKLTQVEILRGWNSNSKISGENILNFHFMKFYVSENPQNSKWLLQREGGSSEFHLVMRLGTKSDDACSMLKIVVFSLQKTTYKNPDNLVCQHFFKDCQHFLKAVRIFLKFVSTISVFKFILTKIVSLN